MNLLLSCNKCFLFVLSFGLSPILDFKASGSDQFNFKKTNEKAKKNPGESINLLIPTE